MAVLGAIAVSGCGSSDPAAVATAPAAYLSGGPAQLERQLGATFRAQLYRVAVMNQTGDDAADLGQDLPTGRVSAVSCSPVGDKPASGDWRWRCGVRWRTVDGAGRRTAYEVQVTGAGCVYAIASSPLRQLHDATTKAPAENPLNSLVVPKKGC